jgi:hypothetical protein
MDSIDELESTLAAFLDRDFDRFIFGDSGYKYFKEDIEHLLMYSDDEPIDYR